MGVVEAEEEGMRGAGGERRLRRGGWAERLWGDGTRRERPRREA